MSLVEGTDFHPDVGCAVLATLSASANWYDNVATAEHLFDIWKQDPVITDAEVEWIRKWVKKRNDEVDKTGKGTKQEVPGGLKEAVGKHWKELPNDAPDGDTRQWGNLRAQFLRALIYTHWQPVAGHEDPWRPNLVVSPEGDIVANPDGSGQLLMVTNNRDLSKAMTIMGNPTREVLTDALGDGMKVRSFYNNIEDPADVAGYGDTTMDTHMISAGVGAPYANTSPEMKAAADTVWKPGGQVPRQFFAEATRRLAERYGYDVPAEIQSVIWEAWQSTQVDMSVRLTGGIERVPEGLLTKRKDEDGTEYLTVPVDARNDALKALWLKVEKGTVSLDAMHDLHIPRFVRGEWP